MVSALDRCISKSKTQSEMIGLVAVDETLEKSVALSDVLYLRATIAADEQDVARADSLGEATPSTEENYEVERGDIEVITGGGGLVSFVSGSCCERGNSRISIRSFNSSSSGNGNTTAHSARDGGQIEVRSGGGSSRDRSCNGTKMKKEDANRGNYDNGYGDNEESDGVHAKRAGT